MEKNIGENKIKAIALMSGGLDSMLAARLVQEQGVDVIGVHFSTGFCTIQRRRRVSKPGQGADPSLRNEALQSAAMIHIPIEIIDVSKEYLPVVLNPKHGYGAHMNPCQDCRAFMLRRAKAYMEEVGAHFIVTGEVSGQRPNSQKKHLLYQTEKESDLVGRILRPLSAKVLRPTEPENQGWVNREQLLGISGRGRTEQIELAAKLGITEFAQPAGGCCMLVEEAFTRRLRDHLAHNPAESLDQEEIALLSVGRHLRLRDGTKVIVGRHEGENNFLDRARQNVHWRFETVFEGSPIGLAIGPLSPAQVSEIASIIAGYSRSKNLANVPVSVDSGQTSETLNVAPYSQEQLWELNVGAEPSSFTQKVKSPSV